MAIKKRGNQQLLDELFKKSRKNTGSGLFTGYDISTYTPEKMSDRKISDSGNYIEQKKLAEAQPKTNQYVYNKPELAPAPQLDNLQDNQNDAQDFLQAFNQQVVPQPQTQQEQQQVYQETGIAYAIQQKNDGGILYADGIIRYPDGTIRQNIQDNAQAIQSMADGSIRYSDGSIRKPAERVNDFITQDNMSYIDGGLDSLIYGIFGDTSNITQKYGNVNAGLGYRNNTHRGTDIVSYNDYKLPVGAEVVEVLQDDGTQWGDISGHQGYGNSVLLRLSSGEMLRFSHLAEPVQFGVGEMIGANQSFGKMGDTGNSYGAHTDLEYYRPGEDTPSDPSQFSGFGVGSQLHQEAQSNFVNKLSEVYYPQSKASPEQLNEIKQTISEVQQPQPQVLGQATENTYKAPQESVIAPEYRNTEISDNSTFADKVGQLVGGYTDNLGNAVSTGINKLNPTGQRYDLGITELMDKNPELAKQKIQETKGNFKEDIGNLGQVLGASIERERPTGDNLDFGGSELFRGDVEGSKAVRQATGENIKRKIQENIGNATTAISEFLSGLKQDAGFQADTGLQASKSIYSKEPNQSLVNINDNLGLKQGSVLGASSNLNPTIATAQTGNSITQEQNQNPNDIRDPFFKTGAYKNFGQYLPNNAEEKLGGALSTSLFDKSFYERRTAEPDIKTVFGGTYMQPEATKKFTTYRTNENQRALNDWRSKYTDPIRYNQDEVNRMFEDLKSKSGSNEFIDINILPQPTYHEPSIEDYLRNGKSIEQWYAETGNQAALDAMGSPEEAMRRYNETKNGGQSSGSGFSQNNGYSSGGGGGGGGGSWSETQTVKTNPTSSYYSSNSGFSAGNGNSGGGGGGGGGGSWSASPSAPKQNIFNQAASTISNLFKRIF